MPSSQGASSVDAAAFAPGGGFDRPDVLILGGGLAGLTLARQLLLGGGLKVLMVDRKEELPGPRQKVGESSVQLAGHYFSKVLDLEEHLLHDHFMKYNLRFYWPAPGRSGTGFEDYSQSYIRHISNVPSYQLDRNRLEEHLLELNSQDRLFRHALGIRKPEVELVQPETGDSQEHQAEAQRHRVRFTLDGTEHEVRPRWVVDATGRNRSLARQMELTDPGRIRHGTFFLWVDGLVDIERLTARSREQVRRSPDRRHVGHMPLWMATNHFMGDGLWLWVIPLRGKTSIGLVYDRATFDYKEVAGPDKLIEWICREFPCFGHDLPRREVLDWGGFKDFAHDSKATISSDRWAVSGVAGRFSDPLYKLNISSPESQIEKLPNVSTYQKTV
ncbi:MAG: hypothetical protein SX243_23520 [Acidobacteriota bacterium]|nr:hypothetical protein [Acidobacteriota bacterium]